jgi:hypothetical protein
MADQPDPWFEYLKIPPPDPSPAASVDPWANVKPFLAYRQLKAWSGTSYGAADRWPDRNAHEVYRADEVDAARAAERQQHTKDAEIRRVVAVELTCWRCGTAAYQPNDRCDSHVSWKDRLQTEVEQHNAWRKRADEAEAEVASLTQQLTEARQENERLKVEATRSLIRGTLRGYAAGESTDGKHWRVRAEEAEQARAALQQQIEKDGVCQWPQCGRPALCSSGNFGGRLVCAEHFKLTNGVLLQQIETLRQALRELLTWQGAIVPVLNDEVFNAYAVRRHVEQALAAHLTGGAHIEKLHAELGDAGRMIQAIDADLAAARAEVDHCYEVIDANRIALERATADAVAQLTAKDAEITVLRHQVSTLARGSDAGRLVALNRAAHVDVQRLEQQARDVSIALSDAGVNAMPIEAAVRFVLNKLDANAAEIERLRADVDLVRAIDPSLSSVGYYGAAIERCADELRGLTAETFSERKDKIIAILRHAARAYDDAAKEHHARSGLVADLLSVITAVKRRLHFVGMPQEARRADGAPDWVSVIAQIEAALRKAESHT